MVLYFQTKTEQCPLLLWLPWFLVLKKKSTNSLPIFAGLGNFDFTLEVDGESELVVVGDSAICVGSKICSELEVTLVSVETSDSNGCN